MGLTYAAATRTVTTRPWTSGVTENDAIYSRLERRDSGRRGLLGWRFLQAPCRGTACTFDLAQPEDEEQNNRADGCADDGGYNP